MKGIFFNKKDEIGRKNKPIDMAYRESMNKNYEIRNNMPKKNNAYSKYFMNDSYEVGGVVKNKKGISNDATDGGLFKGRPHSEGGIKAVNIDTNTPIEVEGGEVVITKDAVSDKTKRDFMGKKMTNKEILSYINQSGGGVALAKGGQIMEDGGEISNYERLRKVIDAVYEEQEQKEEGFDFDLYRNKFKDVIDLLKKKKASIIVQLSIISKSTEPEKYDELQKELTKLSDSITEYEMARDYRFADRVRYFIDSLNSTGNAFNVRQGEKIEDPKKIKSPFDKVIFSEKFKMWFGDWEIARITKNYIDCSKAVDEKGMPEIYFHGGRQFQTVYRPYENVDVFYWAQDFQYAKWFAENAFKSTDVDSVVLRAYLDVKNPIDLTIFGYRKVDMGDVVRYILAFYPQTNLLKYLPKKFVKLIKNQEKFNITIRAWQLIRQFNPWVKAVKKEGVFDGFMYSENNPSHILNGKEHTTKAFAVFYSNQIKFPNQTEFNHFLDDFRFEEGGILI